MSAVSCVNECVGAKDRRAGQLMKLLGRMEITSKWGHITKHILRVDDVLADSTSRWPENKVHENVARLTNQDDCWREHNIQVHGRKFFSLAKQATRRKIGRTDVVTDEQSPRYSHA